MSEAKHDQNRVTVAQGVSSDDGVTPTPIYMDPTTSFIQVDITQDPTLPATLSLTGKHDGNRVPVMYGVTDDANLDVVPIAVDADGKILTDILVT